MYPIIDTHCHYNLPPLSDAVEQYLNQATQHKVLHSIVVGTSHETSLTACALAKTHDHLSCSIGIHPTTIEQAVKQQPSIDLEEFTKHQEKHMRELAKSDHPQVVAIGEAGLDYYRLAPNHPRKKDIVAAQHRLFRIQLEMAYYKQLPIILHIRDTNTQAYQETLSVLADYPNVQYVVHCFSGDKTFITAMLRYNSFFGIDGNITYPNASLLRELLAYIPQERIVLETDAPYLPPQAYRGTVCEPWMIKVTADYLHTCLKLDPVQIFHNSYYAFPKLPAYSV